MKNFKKFILSIILCIQFSIDIFSQIDTIPPTAVCFNGVAEILLPYTGLIKLPAQYFNNTSFDNVTEYEKLRYTFSENFIDTTKIFCEPGINEVTLFVWDEAGNKSSCLCKIIIHEEYIGDACCECYGNSIRPSAVCKENFEVEIESNGFAEVYGYQIGGSSYDNQSGVEWYDFLVNNNYYIIYGCDALGINNESLIVYDRVGFADTCETKINVIDPNNYCGLSKVNIENSSTLNIQPNPANIEVVIQNANQFKSIQIMNSNGEILNKYENLTQNFIINTSELQIGIYFIQGINDNKLTVSTKLVVGH